MASQIPMNSTRELLENASARDIATAAELYKTGRCIFCGEMTSYENRVVQLQVVFDGWKPCGEGYVMKKRPGRMIIYHRVCGEPPRETRPSKPGAA
jgi:hypothetical protein